MDRQTKHKILALLQAKKEKKLWKKAAGALAAVVVFCTAYALILPAITLSAEAPECGIAEHTHTEECYETLTATRLICGQNIHVHTEDCKDEDGSLICGYADFVVHTHDGTCYDGQGNLICPLEEREAHTHTDACYASVLTCGFEESQGHTHTEDCKDENGNLTCGLEESEGHTHTEDCYTRTLTCEKEEILLHTHDEQTCFHQPEEGDPETYLTCDQVEIREHTHTDSCFETVTETVLTCDLEEHTHTQECTPGETEEPQETTAPAETQPTAPEETAAREALCGLEEHTHTENCYGPEDENGERPLICGLEEHIHTEECFAPQEREYRYEDDTILVSVVLSADSQVPEDAVLCVTPITQEEEQYALLAQQAQEAVEGTLEQIILYDLSFYTGDGEYLPVEDSAVVTITFPQGGPAASAEQVTVLHYAQEEAAPVALDEVEVRQDENQELSGVTFRTEGFSTYAVVLTSADTVTAYAATADSRTMYVGQVETVDVYAQTAITDETANIIGASITTATNNLQLGTDATFSGDYANFSSAYYTFSKSDNSENSYTVSSTTADGISVYLCPSSAAGYPFSQSNTNVTVGVSEEGSTDGIFYIYDGTYSLYFYRDGKNRFDRWGVNNSSYGDAKKFLLYRAAAEDETECEELPGHVQVMSLADISNGGKYLIVAEAGGAYYVLYPSTQQDSSDAAKYSHVAKVVPSTLTITAEMAGEATVTAGTTELAITVKDEVSVNQGKTKQIQLPAGAAVNNDGKLDNTIATVDIDNTGLVTITGVQEGTTTVRVTVGSQNYTWNITVEPPTFFTLTYNGNTVTFNMVANNGKALAANMPDITAEDATRYIFVAPGAEEPTVSDGDKVEYIHIPEIPGYRYVGATYNNHTVYSVATAGYTYANSGEAFRCFRFYATEPPTSGQYYTVATNCIVTLTYIPDPITTTVSPSGTVINLFDYWVVKEDEGQVDGTHGAEGINKDHALKFNSASVDTTGTLNKWTGAGKGVLQGIVEKLSGPDGYPMLSGEKQMAEIPIKESLAYLFDPDYTGDTSYRRTYRNVGGLLQVDSNGYYYYDSKQNYAELDVNENRFNVYPDWAVQYNNSDSNKGEFFPFDPYSTVSQSTAAGSSDGKTSSLNHFFGMTMTTRFYQQNNGYADTQGNKPTTFEFSGDDDVWIFIDDVLVADLGGIHDAARVNINFAKGTVTIDKIYGENDTDITTNFADIFANTSVQLDSANKTLANNSYHTLKFYYLERGGNASNLKLQYNLATTPVTGIYKVNQYGNPVKGAKFAVYSADKNYNYINVDKTAITLPSDYTYDDKGNICSGENIIIKAKYVGITDETGQMVFMQPDGTPYSLAELKELFGEYFILREISVPDGYRLVSDEVHLRITGTSSAVLLCDNHDASGTWAAPTLQVQTDGTTITYYDQDGSRQQTNAAENGTLFAVLLKYTGASPVDENTLKNTANWSPVYGTGSGGYTVIDVEDQFNGNFIQAAIFASSKYVESDNVFTLVDGKMQGGLDGMPGDITKYYYMLGNEKKDQTQYTVAYYWSRATGWDNMNNTNTYRVDSDGFTRVFGSTIQVPNLVNRMAVQKLNTSGEKVNGAVFGMYKVWEDNRKIYYLAYDNDGSEISIFLSPDNDCDNQGTASLNGTEGTYQVAEDGKISVTIGSSTYTISPAKLSTTLAAAQNTLKEDGTADFDYMLAGQYYIREVSAPDGYALNPAEVMVLVTENAIYVNAGTANDGVTAARGPGYLSASLQQFASLGNIDNTLSWIYTQMKISDVSTSFTDVTKANYEGSWKYITKNHASNFGTDTVTTDKSDRLTVYLEYNPDSENALFNYQLHDPGDVKEQISTNVSTENRRLYTDIGWSYLEIYQNYPYGSTKAGSAGYENWDGKEISNLFSRSVYVQVTDQKANLEISKTVENAPANAEDSFTFQVDLFKGNAQTTSLTGRYSYTVYTVNGTDREPVKDENGNSITGTIASGGTIQLKANQIAVIENLPYGTVYSITEKRQDVWSYTTTVEQKGVEDPETFAIGQALTASGTLFWNVAADGSTDNVTTVAFTNTYLPELTIQKAKKNSSPEVLLEGAQFELSCKVGNSTYYYRDGSWVTVPEDETAPTIASKKDGEISLRLPDGTYTLKETKAPNGYLLLTAPVTFEVTNGAFTASTPDGSTHISDKLTLTVYNEGSYVLPETGGSGTASYLELGAFILLAAVLMELCIEKRSRRGGASHL